MRKCKVSIHIDEENRMELEVHFVPAAVEIIVTTVRAFLVEALEK